MEFRDHMSAISAAKILADKLHCNIGAMMKDPADASRLQLDWSNACRRSNVYNQVKKWFMGKGIEWILRHRDAPDHAGAAPEPTDAQDKEPAPVGGATSATAKRSARTRRTAKRSARTRRLREPRATGTIACTESDAQAPRLRQSRMKHPKTKRPRTTAKKELTNMPELKRLRKRGKQHDVTVDEGGKNKVPED